MSRTLVERHSFACTLAAMLVFWVGVFYAGLPVPHVDDLFHIGAAIHLAQGGDLSNPYIVHWMTPFGTTKFYVYLPFYPYILSAWIRIFGLSTPALLSFQAVVYALFSLNFALLSRRLQLPLAVPLCVTVAFAAWHCSPNPGTGFRPDALGIAALVTGLWALLRETNWSMVAAGALVTAAPAIAPVTVAYAVPAVIAAAYSAFRQRVMTGERKRLLLIRVVLFTFGAAATVLLFLLCIGFEFRTFLNAFLLHASFRRAPILAAIPHFVSITTEYYNWLTVEPVYLLSAGLVVAVWLVRPAIPLAWQVILLVLWCGIIANTLLYSDAYWFSEFASWIASIAAIASLLQGSIPRWIRVSAVVSSVVVFALSQTLVFVAFAGRNTADASNVAHVREEVYRSRSVLAVDTVAARVIFDYRLPPSTVSWDYLMSAPNYQPWSLDSKSASMTWVVSKAVLGHAIPAAVHDYPRVELFGHQFGSLAGRPFDVVVLR